MQTTEAILANALSPELANSSPLSWGWAAAQFVPTHAEAAMTGGEGIELIVARGILGTLVEIERDRLEGVDPEHLEDAAKALGLDKMPQALRTAVGGYDTDPITHTASYLYRRLFARDSGDGSYLVPDDTAINVMEWHDDRIRRRQAVFEAAGVPDALKERFARQVRDAPWMPSGSARRLERLGRTTVFLDDGFSGVERQIHGGAITRDNGIYQVCLQPTSTSQAWTHEFVHVIEDSEVADKSTVTGLERIFGNMPGVKLLQEAITDQTASSLLNGHPEVTDMTSEFRQGLEYPGGAILLDALCQGGLHPIDVTLFRDARFEDVEDIPTQVSFAGRLLDELESAFPGRNIPWEIGQLGSDNRKDDLLLQMDAMILAAKLYGADHEEIANFLRDNVPLR